MCDIVLVELVNGVVRTCLLCRPHGVVSAYRNDLRQLHVNRVADYIGSGIGTGRFYGVPGTGGNYGYYGYGGYGHPH